MKFLIYSILILFLILVLPLASSAEIILPKDSYSPEETLIAEISGDFIDNPKVNYLGFYKDYRQVSFIYNLGKIGEKFYIYALLSPIPGNYSIIVRKVKFRQNGEIVEGDIIKNFTIEETNNTVIQVNPGFVVATSDFSITLENKGNKDSEVTASFFDQTQSVSLSSQEKRKIDFSISDIESNSGLILVSSPGFSYSLPVSIFQTQDNVTVIDPNQFKFGETMLNASLPIKKEFLFKINLFNYALVDIENIVIEVEEIDNIVSISPEEIPIIPSAESTEINITVKSSDSGLYSGILKASTSDFQTQIPILLEFLEDETLPTSSSIITETKCENIGVVCGAVEICDSASTFTDDNKECCLGICVPLGSSSSSGKVWLGVIIILVVLTGAGLFFYTRYKKQNKLIDPLKQSQIKAEQRLNPPIQKTFPAQKRFTSFSS